MLAWNLVYRYKSGWPQIHKDLSAGIKGIATMPCFYIFSAVCECVMLYVSKSWEELVFPIYHMGPETELGLLGLAAGSLLH